jgi:hypothetical protein
MAQTTSHSCTHFIFVSFPDADGFSQFDFACGGFVIEPTKAIFGPDCKTLVWWSSAIISLPAHFSDHDFTAIAEEIYADESKREGRSLEDIVQNVGFHPSLFAIN